jgi:hypothetical protein
MQHHGMPTRLLDWTESALVALYFSVIQHDDENGELWAIDPLALNRQIRPDLILPVLDNNPEILYLVKEPMVPIGERDSLAKELQLQRPVDKPVAFSPPAYFRRMFTQLSTSTIHPKPQPEKSIPELLKNDSGLARYVIPKVCKRDLRKELDCLGIRESTLFPNLDSVSKQIKRTLREHSG